jgi:predicted DNA-binding transcriptional regulator YafY
MGAILIYPRFQWFEQQAKGEKYPNSVTLASQFEISEKTAQRNIVFMRDRLGCPMEYDYRQKGYYYRDTNFSLPAISLTSQDLIALLVAQNILKNVAGRALGNNIAHAVEKIALTLKDHGADITKSKQAISLRFVEHAPVNDQIFRNALDACLKRKSVEITYSSLNGSGTTKRIVDPYHLYNYMGHWHMIGWRRLRLEYRNFNLSRISHIKTLKETFKVREGFNPEEYFASSFGIFKAWKTQSITLRFSPEKTKWIRGWIWNPKQKEKTNKDGSMELTFPAAAFPELVMEILKHGSGVEVIKPKELRDMVKTEAEKIIRLYRRTV